MYFRIILFILCGFFDIKLDNIDNLGSEHHGKKKSSITCISYGFSFISVAVVSMLHFWKKICSSPLQRNNRIYDFGSNDFLGTRTGNASYFLKVNKT